MMFIRIIEIYCILFECRFAYQSEMYLPIHLFDLFMIQNYKSQSVTKVIVWTNAYYWSNLIDQMNININGMIVTAHDNVYLPQLTTWFKVWSNVGHRKLWSPLCLVIYMAIKIHLIALHLFYKGREKQ